MKKKEEKKSFVDVLLGFIPALLFLTVVVPVLGYFSYAFYSSSIVGSTNNVFNLIMFFIIIGINLIALMGIFYVVNIFTKTDIKRLVILGVIVLLIVVGITVYKYSVYQGLDPDTDTLKWEAAFDAFRLARGISIGYAAYFVISLFINKIAVISVHNKSVKK